MRIARRIREPSLHSSDVIGTDGAGLCVACGVGHAMP